MEYVKIKLENISGVHDGFVQVEQKLNLEPVKIPDRALVPIAQIDLISMTYPITVVKDVDGNYECVGQVTLYRWMKAHFKGDWEVWCLVQSASFVKRLVEQFFLMGRCVSPALSNINSYQGRVLYEYISRNADVWPNEYKSYAHFSKTLGIKPLKGKWEEKQ